VNGNPVAFTWTNNATIQLAAAPAIGDVVDVRRETERVNLLVDFQDASTITERELDLAAQQSFYLAQEAFDATGGTLSIRSDGTFSASGRQIRDIGTPTLPADAANRQWVLDQYNSGRDAFVERGLAEQARDKAQQWADAARNTQVEPNRFSARHHALNAADSASAAAASAASIVADELKAEQMADAAEADRIAAQAARSGAESARDAAQSAQTAAETARNTAQSAATTATGARDTALAYRDQTLTYRDTANSHRVAAETARNEALNFRNTASDHATTANTAANTALSHRNTANDHRLNAAASAAAAAASESQADSHRLAAAVSADEAASYAAGLNLPSASGNAGLFLRQKADESGLEYASVEAFVRGMIMLWSGTIATIPAGWALCNGQNGTPDLRNRFVVGAGGNYAIGDTGGADQVTLTTQQIPAHSHSASVGTAGSHSHTGTTNTTGEHTHSGPRGDGGAYFGSYYQTRSSNVNGTITTSSSGAHSHTLSINAAGAHTHTVTVDSTGGSHPHENRPPYYALAYIMKL
jgi:microcystin-dependent protein